MGWNQAKWCTHTWRTVLYCSDESWYDDLRYAEDYATMLVRKWHYTWDVADAFQHVIWMALAAARVGATQARLLGEAHEADTPNNNVVDRARDLGNNRTGRIVGARQFQKQWTWQSLHDYVVSSTLWLYINGQLRCTTRRRVIFC
jgi:hypothetical protein